MNIHLVELIVQVIRSLSPEKQAILEEKLFFGFAYPSPPDPIAMTLRGNSFEFLNDEPDLYSLDDGEPIPCP